MDTQSRNDNESSEPLSSRFLIALCLTTFLAALNFFAVTPFYAVIANDLKTTVPLLGQVTTLMILLSALLGLVIGPLSDRFGQRIPLLIGVLAVAINLIGMGLAISYPMLLALSVTGGLADALVFNLPFAVIGKRLTGAEQRKALSWAFASISAAPIFGVPLLTTIGEQTGWRIALVIAGLSAIVCGAFVWNAVPRDDDRPTDQFQFLAISQAYLPLLRDRHVLRLYGVTVGRSITWFGGLTYLGAFLTEELALSTRSTGFVYTVAGIGAVTGSALGTRMHPTSVRKLVAAACLVSAAAVGLVFVFPHVWGTIPLVLLIATLSSIMGVGITSLLAIESLAGSGTTLVLNGSLLNLGAAIGAGFGGLLLSLSGYSALGFGLPMFAVIAAALALWPERSTAHETTLV